MKFHCPHTYRYEVAKDVRRRRPWVALNRYPGAVIGVAVMVGRYAYCLKWASA